MIFFDSPEKKPLNKSNTFFDDQFKQDLFASFTDMKTPATLTTNNTNNTELDVFNDPMTCSTPTPTSSGSSSTFLSAMITNDESNTNIDLSDQSVDGNSTTFSAQMRESMGRKQIIDIKAEQIEASIEKPKGKIEKKKKQKKFKPTNLLLNATKAEVVETKVEDPIMKPPKNDEGTYSQVDYEITASGAFWIDDVKITEEGITNMPSTICTQTQTQSPFKPVYHLESISSPSKTSRFMNQTNGANLLHFEKKKHGNKIASISFSTLETVKKLGEGASSTVDLVKDADTGRLYAKKMVKLAKDIQPKLILSEITTLYNCVECSNILRFYNAYFADNKIHILLEYMDGNSLESLAGIKLPEKILEMITFQVLKGLYFLHFRKKIVHRDLKPANILIKLNGEVKISDMGLTGIFKKNNQVSEGGKYGPRNQHVWNTCQGTIMYMSPERINEKPHSYNSDIWSLGVTLVELALGEFPFKTGTYFDVMDEINNVERRNPLEGKGFSEVFEDFIKNCLKISPDERYSCRDLLSHQFVYKYLNTPDQVICEQISRYMAEIAKLKKDHQTEN